MFVTPGSRSRRKRNVSNNQLSAPLSLNFGTITANPAEPTPGMALAITGTWANAGVTFDAPIWMNVVDGGSGSGSLLMDLQVGGTPWVRINKSGVVTLGNGQGGGMGTPGSISLPGPNGTGTITLVSGAVVAINGGSTYPPTFDSGQIGFLNTGTQPGGSQATFLYEGSLVANGGGLIGQRTINAAIANSFRVYNTGSDTTVGPPTNYERVILDWATNSNMATIGPQAGGTGTLRDMAFIAATKNIWLINSANTKVGSASGAVWQHHHDHYGGL